MCGSDNTGGGVLRRRHKQLNALTLMEEALASLDEAEGPAHVAAHLQQAIDFLRDEMGDRAD